MPVLPGGGAANDNRSAGARPWLRLDLVPDVWSGRAPAADTVAWIEDVWSGPAAICPESRLMPTGPD